MASVTEKLCSVCGADLRQSKRVKDVAGNYYCEGCVQAARQQRRHPEPPQAPRSGKVCGNCGNPVGALQKLHEWNGHQVCLTCRDDLKYESERQQEDQQRQTEEEAQRSRDTDAARLTADRTSKEADRRRYRMLLGILGCLAGGTVTGAAAIVISDEKDLFMSRIECACAIGFVIYAMSLVIRYKRLVARPIAESLRADLLPAFTLFGRGFSYGMMLFGLVGVLAIGAWGGAKVGALLFTDNDFAWWAGFLAGGLTSLCVILPIGGYLDSKWCPHCNSLKAHVERVEFLGQKSVTTRTHENITVHQGYGSFGPVLETIRMPVERTRLINRYARHRLCSACGMRWTT